MAKEEPKEKDEEKKEGDAAAAPKSKKKLFIIIGGLVVLLLGAGVPLMLMGGGEKKEEEQPHEEVVHEKTLTSAPFDVFIVNLSETGAFLKVRLLMEYDEGIVHAFEAKAAGGHGDAAAGGGHDAKGGLSGYLKVREPMIRDAVLRILSTKTSTEVLTLAGKEKLKEELIEGMNEAIGIEQGPVQAVYFTEFIIQ